MIGQATRKWIGGAIAIAAMGAFAFGLFHLSPWAASWDEVDFVLALDRYDLLAMQPHAPGYPYFILGGRLMRLWTGIDGPAALSLWNLLLTASSVFPLYRLARRWLQPFAATVAAALVLTLPMNAALGVRAMSEGAALALMWWYLWAAVRAAERPTTARFLGAAFAFSLLMGTRLSYAPLGLALGWIWLGATTVGGANRQTAARLARGFVWLVCAALCQLLWLAGMAAAEGGAGSMLVLLKSFALGHFEQWGGGAIADPMSPASRLLLFFGDNVLWTGAFARSEALLAAAALLLGSAIIAAGTAGREARAGAGVGTGTAQEVALDATAVRTAPNEGSVSKLETGANLLRSFPNGDSTQDSRGSTGRSLQPASYDGLAHKLRTAAQQLRRPTPGVLLVAASAAYALWALLGQNIAKPRHAAPIAALLLFGLAVQALRKRPFSPPAAAKAALASALLLLAAQTTEAARLVALQDSQRPAVYRLADYAKARMPADAVLYTWEEERVLYYLRRDIQTRPIYTYAYFLADLQAAPDRRIWLTGAVLEGFRRQGAPTDHARLLARFSSDGRLDPVYGNISLYEWVR